MDDIIQIIRINKIITLKHSLRNFFRSYFYNFHGIYPTIYRNIYRQNRIIRLLKKQIRVS